MLQHSDVRITRAVVTISVQQRELELYLMDLSAFPGSIDLVGLN